MTFAFVKRPPRKRNRTAAHVSKGDMQDLHPLRWILVFTLSTIATPLNAQPPQVPQTSQPPTTVTLQTGHLMATRVTASFSGKPVHAAIRDLADTVNIAMWFDLAENPSSPVEGDFNNVTFFDAVVDLSGQAGLAVWPIDGVVVVAKPDTIADWCRQPLAGNPVRRPVRWSLLTTPNDAVRTLGQTRAAALPHDLLPAVDFRDAPVQRLDHWIRSAYRRPSDGTGERFGDASPTESKNFGVRYPSTAMASEAFASKHAELAGDAGDLASSAIETSFDGHARLLGIWIDELASDKKPDGNIPPDDAWRRSRFTLRVQARAEEVLSKLAAAAGKRLHWPNATDAQRDRIVSLEAEDQTLIDLVDEIIRPMNLSADWQTDRLIIEPSP